MQQVEGSYQYAPTGGYQQTTYVTGGSGVGQQTGYTQQGYTTQQTYVTGGSGVRGSRVRQEVSNLGY